jgi:hypothetical protein
MFYRSGGKTLETGDRLHTERLDVFFALSLTTLSCFAVNEG